MTNNYENGNLDSIIDDMLDKVSPLDSQKVEDRLLLAARIGDLIAERGLSKKQFAEMMEKEPSVISRWLGGTHNFTQDTLSEISFKLGIPLAEFYQAKPAPIVFRSSFHVVQASGYAMGTIQMRPIPAPSTYGLVWLAYDPSNISFTGMEDSHEWLQTMNAQAICSRLSGHSRTVPTEKESRVRHPEENTVRKA